MASEVKSGRRIKVKKSSATSAAISPFLLSDEVTEELRHAFTSHSEYSSGNGEVKAYCDPFPHCTIDNFVSIDNSLGDVPSFTTMLRLGLLSLSYMPKENDLFKFVQTNELMNGSGDDVSTGKPEFLKHFCRLLKTVFLPWLRGVTGIALNDDVNMFSAQYGDTDYLLCHDDELEHRRIAYVYYLTAGWRHEDGGSLQLFDSKITSHKSETYYDPGNVVKSIVPTENSLVFFEVCPQSFHQVSEVETREDKRRVSLTGWFHGPTHPRPSRPLALRQSSLPLLEMSSGESECLADWINPIYLSMATQAEIQQQFVDDSEIKLCDFLLPDKHELLTDSLRTLQKSPTSGAKVLESVSFPNRQVYERIPHHLLLPQDGARESHDATDHSPGRREEEEEKAPEQQGKRSALNVVRSLVALFQSEEMFLYLSNLSGLSLHPLASDSDDDESEAKKQKLDDVTAAEDVIASTNQSNSARCSCQVRRWREGFYTLLRDNGGEGKFALDINLYVGPREEWREEYGGCTIYVADNEAEELLTILPTDNCLSMVYRDVSASKFVKYLNHKSRDREFFDLSLAYYE